MKDTKHPFLLLGILFLIATVILFISNKDSDMHMVTNSLICFGFWSVLQKMDEK